MKLIVLAWLLAAVAGSASAWAADTPPMCPVTTQPAMCPATRPDAPLVLGFAMKSLSGEDVPLARYCGKVVLIVNVASRCGYTPQYKGLEELHETYGPRGLAVLGMPCNQFGGQEPGTSEQIQQFCQSKYSVKFDMFGKIDVNGDKAAPLYRYLTGPDLPVADKGPVKWNFEKFLVSRDGRVIARYRSAVKPEQIAQDIEAALGK
ncbi:MAG: glutathione peroxidase [Phycisphaerae bacterium]|nr:glutathione peroxidase [Phycisphaerae bacterium]